MTLSVTVSGPSPSDPFPTPKPPPSSTPTAIQVQAGADDPLFPVASVPEMGAEVADAYAAAGHADRFEVTVFDGDHDFPARMRTAAYDFLAATL